MIKQDKDFLSVDGEKRIDIKSSLLFDFLIDHAGHNFTVGLTGEQNADSFQEAVLTCSCNYLKIITIPEEKNHE